MLRGQYPRPTTHPHPRRALRHRARRGGVQSTRASRVIGQRRLLLCLHGRQPLHKVLVHNLCPLVAQRNHARLHADGLELRAVEVVGAAAELLKVDLR